MGFEKCGFSLVVKKWWQDNYIEAGKDGDICFSVAKHFLKLPTVVVWDTNCVLITLGSEEKEVAKQQ